MDGEKIKRSMRHAFMRGVARLVNPFGILNDYPQLDSQEDTKKLAQDWQSVGDDLRNAIQCFADTPDEEIIASFREGMRQALVGEFIPVHEALDEIERELETSNPDDC